MKALVKHQLEMTICSRNKLDEVGLIQSKFLSRPPALRIKAVGCCMTTRSLKQRGLVVMVAIVTEVTQEDQSQMKTLLPDFPVGH